MLVSTSPKLFNTHGNKACESSMSPKYYHRPLFTPKSKGHPVCDPPSPLRNRPLFPLSTNIPDSDDMIQSPFKSPPLVPPHNALFTLQPQTIPADDEEGNIFLSTAASFAQPPLTPLKQPRRVPSSTVLSSRQQITVAPFASDRDNAVSRGTAGTKRKSSTTPLRQQNTPLRTSQSAGLNDSGISFDRLAPLLTPKFGAFTPPSKAETDAHLKRQTDTLTRLRLSDPEVVDFDDAANDSGSEMEEGSAHRSPTMRKHPKPLIIDAVHSAKTGQEVAETISPGGHVTKRRARSRPVSSELLEGVLKSPKKSPLKSAKPSAIPCRIGGARPRHSGAVAFPSTTHRGCASPASLSSSSEAGSPRPRRRISGISRPAPLPPLLPRAPFNRIESNSSATLFFGPAIPRPSPANLRSRTSSNFSSSTPAPSTKNLVARPGWTNRHSYAGTTTDSNTWNTFQMRNTSPSPGTSPDKASRDNSMDDEDMFFAEGSSFVLNVINNTPSPPKAALPKKFKPSDSSGVNDEDEMPSLISFRRDSNSVSSFSDDGLVTPLCGPETNFGWPIPPAIIADPCTGQGIDIDEFIQKTLADASKGSSMPKKAPGTPVKKSRVSYFGHERPWQSAVASKVGLKDEVEFKKMPRKSLPAVLSGATARASKSSIDWQPTDTEDEEEYSPSTRRNRYPGLGLGQPHATQLTGKPDVSLMWSRWPGIIRRSSSGAFSSGSESASVANTPTRIKATDWQLPKPRLPLRFSPSSDAIGTTFRSTSGSSNSSTISSPTINRANVAGSSTTQAGRHARLPRPSVTSSRRLSDICMDEEQPGKFEHDFDEIEEIGSGEFGKVMKVKSKNGSDGVVSAVKRSKRFEGAKHRLRLREEVDILKHLSQVALTQTFTDGRHPNVLGYIDSWEEDEALYIRTELCEYGNLARFLWEYGRVFPRLDEARVWKIIADLSSGLGFIHSTSVIHLDLKPSNVFVTKDGRFKIGDFGMASLWPRLPVQNTNSKESESASLPARGCHAETTHTMTTGGFEREGDKLYLAPEVLQGCYSKAADVFSLGMTILETASNIVVPDQGEAWHRLRNEDFSQVDLEHHSEALVDIIRQMMRTDPTERLTSAEVERYPPVGRARSRMEELRLVLSAEKKNMWGASPLASVPAGFLEEVLSSDSMDTS